MSSKLISSILQSVVTSTNKTTSFWYSVSAIESRRWVIFITRMKLEILKRIDWSGAVLPNISNDIIKITNFKKVDRIWWKPIFHIDIACLAMFPFKQILIKKCSHCTILIFSWKPELFIYFGTFPIAKSSCL